MLTALLPPTLSETKLSTSTLPCPSGEDEIVAWTGDGQLRFSVVLLKVLAWLPCPVPVVEGLTFTGPKSWIAVWAAPADVVAAMQTAARPCKKTELFILSEPPLPNAIGRQDLPRGRVCWSNYWSLTDCAVHRISCQLKLRAGRFFLDLPQRFFCQLVDPAKPGKQHAPNAGNGQRSQTAGHDGAHRSPPLCSHAALKFAQFIGSSNKEGIHCAHSPPHGRRGCQLQHGRPDHHAHHVRRPHHHQSGKGKH